MTALGQRLFGAKPQPVPAANDDCEPQTETLNDLERQIIEARNNLVHCQAALHAAEMRLATCQDRLEEEINSRALLVRDYGPQTSKPT